MENKKKFKPDQSRQLKDQICETLRDDHYAYRTEQTYVQQKGAVRLNWYLLFSAPNETRAENLLFQSLEKSAFYFPNLGTFRLHFSNAWKLGIPLCPFVAKNDPHRSAFIRVICG